jgi:hypothetical protein
MTKRRRLDEHEVLKPSWAAEREVKPEAYIPNMNITGNIGAWVGRATKNSFPNGVPKSS